MPDDNRIVPVILCGGAGSRLWPLSRDGHPKQFLRLLGRDSLLQDTVAVSHGGSMRALLVALDVETPVGAADLTVEQGVVYVFCDGQVTKHS